MKLVEAEMERRRAIRFPVRLPVRYSMKEAHAAHGAGEILNMSSNGVLLTTESHLEPLKTVLLVISWPALLDGEIPLNLVASGRVVRSWDGKAAVRIQKYEFRTCRREAVTRMLA